MAIHDDFITKIDDKCRQLQAVGLTLSDQEVLKRKRLSFIWNEPTEGADSGNSATVCRKRRARRAYTEIQNADNHLFLSFALTIPPTECGKRTFGPVLEHFHLLGNFQRYHVSLDAAAKKFFESTAAEQGFIGSRSYVKFMETLFPQSQEPRQIQFAYSLIRLDDLPAFFDVIQKGIYSSKQAKKEEVQGLKTSSCVTVLIPTGQQDGSCNMVIDRKVLMEAIYRFQLSDLRLE